MILGCAVLVPCNTHCVTQKVIFWLLYTKGVFFLECHMCGSYYQKSIKMQNILLKNNVTSTYVTNLIPTRFRTMIIQQTLTLYSFVRYVTIVLDSTLVSRNNKYERYV